MSRSARTTIRSLAPESLKALWRRLRRAEAAGDRPSRPWATPGSFGAMVADRKQWLFETLPPDAASYHYDIFAKVSQKRLARRLGLSVARDYVERAPLAEALATVERLGLERFALKPDSSHNAVGFRRIVRVGDGYHDLGSGKRGSLRWLERSLRREVAARGRADAWVVEELLMPPDGPDAPVEDYKFYCFGGVTEIILHKWPAPNGVGTQRNWYARDWSPIVVSVRGPGEGVPRAPLAGAQLVDVAERAASRLCYPFIRMDLYDTSRGVVFGEFTPGPGLINAFTDAWSERLRLRWLEAEAALRERIRSGELVPLAAATTEAQTDGHDP